VIRDDHLHGRHRVFDPVAESYASTRPGYPSSLIDDVLGFAGLGPGAEMVEVAAGTGKATALFASRGLRVLALEPAPRMAAQARLTCRGQPVEVVESRFEDWDGERGRSRFPLLACAQAWHWMDRSTRLRRAHRVLAPGGTLALWWNRHTVRDPSLRQQLNAVYEEIAPSLVRLPDRPPAGSEDDELGCEIGESGLFGDLAVRLHPWSTRYSTEAFVGMVGTYSDHLLLPGETLRRLLGAMGRAIDSHGGDLQVDYVATLYLARSTTM